MQKLKKLILELCLFNPFILLFFFVKKCSKPIVNNQINEVFLNTDEFLHLLIFDNLYDNMFTKLN